MDNVADNTSHPLRQEIIKALKQASEGKVMHRKLLKKQFPLVSERETLF